jgi:nuclease HARBI1
LVDKSLNFHHHIYRWFGRLLDIDSARLTPARMQIYADAISREGAPLSNIFGFIDGTVRPICRPKYNQKMVYNGHQRTHALKFQSIMAPDGIILHLSQPFEGKRHDCGILWETGILDQLKEFAFSSDGEPFSLYGDAAYPLTIRFGKVPSMRSGIA